ncbi:hypothetical protein PUNSTDRAFT_91208 [Punctularia strigosozonata HHB-11173 SS5]|uniref:uncharacterized protein n=1 Tax=Punctularia strigosozonata (strain HHB-11173) TaxID=741275 RepID=UPI0004417FAA|nr:uncharacterized protein PUNSTDRAFT_91208 [Punctularia strigosozonata HHB-11173 SS5]EIN05655.1 hypothetical protein PUNSTDRAFT_91208 [Punctularia strigosozonata HHB-11173 SS5]
MAGTSSSAVARRPHLQALRVILSRLDVRLPRAMSLLFSVLKYALGLLLLVNIRAIPLSWHFRVFAPVFKLRYQWYLLVLKTLFKSPEEKLQAKEEWLEKLMPVGKSPFELEVRHQAWAGPEDCDYNMHLSNSCYPKILDQARLKAALATCPTFFRAGGWMPLGATHHQFIREVPIFANFEVRLSIGSWDKKWLYIVARFVSHPKNKSKKPQAMPSAAQVRATLQSTGKSDSESELHENVPMLHTPAEPLEAESSPSATPGSVTPNPAANAAYSSSPAPTARAPAATPEPDGATLHCIAVSAICFKIGRITVPPALALAAEGFSHAPPSSSTKEVEIGSYSLANPPPHWTTVRALRPHPLKLRDFRKFLSGGWREVSESERWWEQALGAEVERTRAERLPSFEGIRKGLEDAREYRT